MNKQCHVRKEGIQSTKWVRFARGKWDLSGCIEAKYSPWNNFLPVWAQTDEHKLELEVLRSPPELLSPLGCPSAQQCNSPFLPGPARRSQIALAEANLVSGEARGGSAAGWDLVSTSPFFMSRNTDKRRQGQLAAPTIGCMGHVFVWDLVAMDRTITKNWPARWVQVTLNSNSMLKAVWFKWCADVTRRQCRAVSEQVNTLVC